MEHLDRISTERVDLYRCRPPEGICVPITVITEKVDNVFPEEADIEQAVRGLKRGRSGSLYGMQAEDIKGWLQEASQEKNPARRECRLLVRLTQRTFKDGVVPY